MYDKYQSLPEEWSIEQARKEQRLRAFVWGYAAGIGTCVTFVLIAMMAFHGA